MKINGKTIERAAFEVIVIPRQSGDIVFKCGIIKSFAEFLTICPQPLPPTVTRPGGETIHNVNDKDYLAANEHWANNRLNWMILTSLTATENLVFDTVDMKNPDTWKNWQQEMLDAGFTDHELYLLIETVISANGLSPKRIEEATKNFLAGQAAKLPSQSSPTGGQ